MDTHPKCETYRDGDYVDAEQPFTAIQFDVALDQDSAPMSFGSPDWFRAKSPDGYVTDDITISSGACDDAYPEFTDNDLNPGDRHKGWIMFQDTKLKPDDQLDIVWPYSTDSAAFTVPS
ncbi:hypothetical protein ACPXCG_03380 [Gordonia sp. DT218]|uniref:hypothetical protein n=1 Tax=Gordonia sp. DT218 TaxID=3416659 RepID=UPI003CEF945A